jgi:hypothetical protein
METEETFTLWDDSPTPLMASVRRTLVEEMIRQAYLDNDSNVDRMYAEEDITGEIIDMDTMVGEGKLSL